MSKYTIEQVLFDIAYSQNTAADFQRDRRAFVQAYRLTGEEEELCSGQTQTDTFSSGSCHFKLPGGLVAQGRVESAAVVLHLDILDHITASLQPGGVTSIGQPLAL